MKKHSWYSNIWLFVFGVKSVAFGYSVIFGKNSLQLGA
jgi:hypothetical protein